MKSILNLTLIFTLALTHFACGGFGGGRINGPDSNGFSITETSSDTPNEIQISLNDCLDSTCSTSTPELTGNFTLTETKNENGKNLPTLTVDDTGEILTITCSEDATTENALYLFNCNQGTYFDHVAQCIDGVLYSGVHGEANVYSTDCQSKAFYCDAQGFAEDGSCHQTN